jgi:peptidoglycan/LPS O-acetylase OafA/YrhL
LVIAIGVYYALAGPAASVPGLTGDGIATLLYFSNWHQIAIGTNYFAASGPVSPLQHTWSLAIEEQFYVVWPLVVLALLWLGRRLWNRRHGGEARDGVERGADRKRRALWLLFVVCALGIVGSAVDTALLIDGGRGLNRVYYGTDTRASALLIGALLAIGLQLASSRAAFSSTQRPLLAGRSARILIAIASVVALGVTLGGIRIASGSSMTWLYPYGLLGFDLACVGLIATAVLARRSPVARLFALAPLRKVGEISYGLYLWHFPLFLWLDADNTGLSGTSLLGFRLAVTLAVSLLSYVLVEQPVRRRQVPRWLVRSLAPVTAAASVAALLAAGASGSLAAVSANAVVPKPAANLAGSDPACSVALQDAPGYGLAPVAPSKIASFEITSLDRQKLTWNSSAKSTFNTCPPSKVLVVGDSLAFTLAVPMQDTEQEYGVELADAAILGCAFTTRGDLDVNGTWEPPPAGCNDELSTWKADAERLDAKEVVVEMGYRDEFNWRWNGKVVHLGDTEFDTYLQKQINHFVQSFTKSGIKVLFLSVPYTKPPDQANGAPAPAASPARHKLINMMLQQAADSDPSKVQVLSLDNTVSPGNHYDATVNGQLCRFDGIHFTIYCAKLVEPSVLGTVKKSL